MIPNYPSDRPGAGPVVVLLARVSVRVELEIEADAWLLPSAYSGEPVGTVARVEVTRAGGQWLPGTVWVARRVKSGGWSKRSMPVHWGFRVADMPEFVQDALTVEVGKAIELLRGTA